LQADLVTGNLRRSVFWQQLIKGEIEIAPMGLPAADAHVKSAVLLLWFECWCVRSDRSGWSGSDNKRSLVIFLEKIIRAFK
jgi:hypothetical protein